MYLKIGDFSDVLDLELKDIEEEYCVIKEAKENKVEELIVDEKYNINREINSSDVFVFFDELVLVIVC